MRKQQTGKRERRVGNRWVIGLVCLVLLASGCGSRLSRATILAENTAGGGAITSGGASTGPGSRFTGSHSGDNGSGTTSDTVAGGTANNGGGTTSNGTGSATTLPGETVTGNSHGSSGSQISAAGCNGQATGTPIVVGFIGDLSGFGSSTSVPSEELWQAWSKMVNASGGINCHPVQLLVGDDGGSTSSDASLAEQFVQQDGAIALSWASTDPSGLASYVQAHNIPVIGTETGGAAWTSDSMFFAPFGVEAAGNWGMVQAAKAQGATKLGILYCVESPAVCSSTAQQYEADATAQGVSVVYAGQISLTQPDYTANCLQAQSKGVQVLYVLGDTNTEIRVAQSCARQGFDPIYEMPESEDSFTSIPQLNNTLAVTSSFPWFLTSGSPALDQYEQTLQRYAPSLASNGQGTQTWGWVSAKVFQEAATIGTAGLSPSAKVTSQDILNGLWSMKDDTIGGLDPGPMARTFTKGQVAPIAWCVFVSKLENGRWVAPNGMIPLCRS